MNDEQALTPYETREILFYKTDNGDVRVEILLFQENLWLTQVKMSEHPEYQIYNAMEKIPFCKDYFRKCFKKETGMTPISYLINLRVEYAKKLLSQRGENNHTISDIALISGFYDYHYFSRVFKNIVGVTPQEYKRLINT